MATWKETLESLPEAIQNSSEASELIRKATAPARHAARVRQVLEAVMPGLDPVPEITEGYLDTVPWFVLLRAWGLLLLDIIGIGGVLGLGGSSGATTRIPALQGCGSGRKQANDGGAWTAAVWSALELLQKALDCQRGEDGVEPMLVPLPNGAGIGVSCADGTRDCVVISDSGTEWAKSATRCALVFGSGIQHLQFMDLKWSALLKQTIQTDLTSIADWVKVLTNTPFTTERPGGRYAEYADWDGSAELNILELGVELCDASSEHVVLWEENPITVA